MNQELIKIMAKMPCVMRLKKGQYFGDTRVILFNLYFNCKLHYSVQLPPTCPTVSTYKLHRRAALEQMCIVTPHLHSSWWIAV